MEALCNEGRGGEEVCRATTIKLLRQKEKQHCSRSQAVEDSQYEERR